MKIKIKERKKENPLDEVNYVAFSLRNFILSLDYCNIAHLKYT